MALNPKQERFCKEYVIDCNATKAGIRAGYSEDSAYSQAHDLLKKPEIADFIRQLQFEIGERLEITADMVVQELAKLAFSNTQDFVKTGNDIKDISKLERHKVAAVSGIKTTEIVIGEATRTTTELKFHDKVSALEKLGKHLGVFEKDNAQKKMDVKTLVIEPIASRHKD